MSKYNHTTGKSLVKFTSLNNLRLFTLFALGLLSAVPLPLFAQAKIGGNNDSSKRVLLAQADANAQNNQNTNQGANANNTTGPNGSGDAEAEAKVKQLLQYVELLEQYGPRTMEQKFISKDFEENLLKGVKDALVIVSNHFLSTVETLEYVQTTVSNNFYLLGIDFYRLDFGFPKDYYKELYKFNRVRNNYYFEKNLRFLYQIEKVLDDNSELMIQAFGQDNIYPLIYETKLFIGNILMFKGMTQFLDDAKARYEYILGKNPYNHDFIPNNELRNKVYNIMLDVYDRYFYNNYYHNTDYRKLIIYSREKLFYLWQIVDVNHEDQAIKDLKYRRLFTTYAPIMDPDSEDYKNIYSKYRKDTDRYPDLTKPKKYDKQGKLITEEGETTTQGTVTNPETQGATDATDTTQGGTQNNVAPATTPGQ